MQWLRILDAPHTRYLWSDLALNDLVGAIEMLQKNILVQRKDGVESHKKRLNYATRIGPTELEVRVIKESLD